MSEQQREKGYKEAGQLFGGLLRGQARGKQRSARSDTSGAVEGGLRVWSGMKHDWSRPRVTTSSRSGRIKALNRQGRLRKHLYESGLAKDCFNDIKVQTTKKKMDKSSLLKLLTFVHQKTPQGERSDQQDFYDTNCKMTNKMTRTCKDFCDQRQNNKVEK